MQLTDEQARQLLKKVYRYETAINPHVYLKAVRVTLHELGYDDKWLETDFRDLIDEIYQEEFDKYEQEKKSQAGHWYPPIQ